MSGGTTETKTTSLSPWMEEAAKTQLGKATALTDINQNPYKQYEGQRIAEFNPMQQQYFQGVQNLQGSGAIGQGIGAAGEATQRALGTSYNPYQTGQFGAQASQYMDPYMQNVVDIQQREAQRQADIARTQSNATAVKSGAFGGSRQAIVDAEAARNLATQKGDIQARGLQDAYSRAQQQFNTEQALGESSRQYGAGLGMQGLQTALSGASQLGGLGSTQFGQQKDILTAQQTAGAQQQAQEQAKLSQGYEDFLAQQKYPYQQLEFMSNIMRGTPYGTTTSMYSPGPSTGSTLLGAGTSLAGAAMLGGWKPWMKEGGLATAYAAGGSVRSPENIRSIADSLLDADLSQAAAMAQARGDKQQDDVVQQEMASRAALRRGAQAMPEDQGIGQLPAGNMTYANGGIIAFADGGDVERYNGLTGSVTGGLYDTAKSRMAAAQQKLYGYGLAQRQKDPAGFQAAQDELQAAKAAFANASERYATDVAAAGADRPAFVKAPTSAAIPQMPAPITAATPGVAPVANRALLNQSEQAARRDPAVYSAPVKADETGIAGIKGGKTPPVTGAAPRVTDDTAAKDQPSGLDALLQPYLRQQEQNIGAMRNATTQYSKSLKDEGVALVAEEEKRIAEKADPYKAREARLLAQEKEAMGMDSKYAGLALLQAGAAIMSTPGGLGMALGKGVQVGSDRYLAGIEKINAAKEKFALAKERLEDLRLNRADMNERDIRDAKKEARTLTRQGDALFYSGAKDELNMKDKQITAVMGIAANALNTDKQIAAERENTLTRERGANARASMLSPNARDAMLLGTGNTDAEKYASGLKKLQELTGDKHGTQMLKLFLEENARREKNMERPLTLEQFRRTSAAFFAPPAAVDTGKPTRP